MKDIKDEDLIWLTQDELWARGYITSDSIRSRFKRKQELDWDGNGFEVTYTEFGYLEKNSRCSKCGE